MPNIILGAETQRCIKQYGTSSVKNNLILKVKITSQSFFFFLWYWVLNSGPSPLSHSTNPIFVTGFSG
jgi:hypothetical protein